MKSDFLKGFLITSAIGFLIFISVFLFVVLSSSDPPGNVAVIKLRGVIVSDLSSGGVSGAPADQIIENLKKAEKNPSIKAILIDVNSPGGSAVASEEVAMAIKNLEKPTITLIRDIGTSGAYWAASSSDLIVASPLSITGSVGATASYLEFSGLFDRYGVGYEQVSSGEFKDTGSPFKNLSPDEREIFDEVVKSVGDYFVESVKEERNLSSEVVEQIRSGRFYTGKQAKDLGLIDELGGMSKAEELIKRKAEIKEIELAEYEIEKPFNLASLLSSMASIAGRSAASSLVPENQRISRLT